jgi:RHS repeat-associated protein
VFEYDAAGSIQKMLGGLDTGQAEEEGKGPWEIATGNLLMQTEGAKYTYDTRGRRIAKQELGDGGDCETTEYVWDCRDRLREVKLPSGSNVRFDYDAFSRRVRKEVSVEARRVDFVWDGDVLAADIDHRRGARCFVHEPGTFVPLLHAEQGEVLSYVNDHLGMPKELIDRSGNVAWSATHSAWGKVTETRRDPKALRVESPFRLLGQYADAETGLCYARFRYFDAEVGRWCSPDPLGIIGGRNATAFDESPTTTTDPMGLSCKSLDELSKAASKSDRGGLTKAGRALQKHSVRPGSAFPKVSGKELNTVGQDIVDDILTNPDSTTVVRHHARFGEVTEVVAPDGRGVRYDSLGEFMGFLEP